MPPATESRRSSSTRLPAEAYASHVDALFSDRSSLLIGTAAAFCMTVATAYETRRVHLLLIALALSCLGAIRLGAMGRFARLRPSFVDADLHRWERWYVIGGVAYVALLGLFCVASFAEDDAFARLASVAGLLAYLVGIPGRSFASTLLVNTQIGAAAVPLLLSVLMADRRYVWIGLFVFLPFLVALKTISGRLHGIFVSAVARSQQLERLAGRFDTALNNMPHGLAMFEPSGDIVVTNRRLADLMRTSPEAMSSFGTLHELGAACTRIAVAGAATSVQPWSGARSDGPLSEEWTLAMADGRTVAFRQLRIAAGGGVLIAEDVTERVRAQAEVAYLARHDPLTGLYNRHSFADGVEALRGDAAGRHTALLFVDLDRFKAVNDTFGHAVGDRLIVEVARRLARVAGPGSVLARLGGDEFVIFGAFDDDVEGPAALASAAIDRLSAPYDIDGHLVEVGASIGIAPSYGRADVEALLTDADLALYRAKDDGRGSFRFFEAAMQARALARRGIEDDLRHALRRGELEVHYQPVYSLERGAFVMCEALVRWRHPRRGLVPPSEFVPIAEEIGLIREIGEWVLLQACLECASWPGDVAVAVNVSAVQFRQGDLLAPVRHALGVSGLAPDRLELEVTESALLGDVSAAGATLRQLRDVGVGVSLDDFGTGYSSLSYLQSLPFSKVKIDRSFLQDLRPGSRAMVLLNGIARLSVELGMTVVVEGVETAEQLDLVSSQGSVTLIQGYLFSQPLTVDRLRLVLRSTDRSKVA